MATTTYGLTPELLQYLRDHSVTEHPVQTELRIATSKMEKSVMQISPEQGKMMQILVGLTGAKRCLEVGVFTGYSALSVALALPTDGIIKAFDISEEWTSIAREHWRKAGVEHKIDLNLVPATEGLQDLIDRDETGTYDFAFIDADKTGYDDYYELCLKLLRPGALIVIDNTLWEGKVVDPLADDPDTLAIKTLNEKIAADRRVEACILPVGDGVTMIRVKHKPAQP